MCYILYIGSKGEPEIPQAVVKEGFDLSELKRSFNRAQNDLPVLAFVKKPTLKFYKELHKFLMHWQHSRDTGVTAIGKFYNAIDPYLRQKGLIHYNAYRYIQQQIRKCSTLEDTLSLPYQSHVKDNVRDFEEVATIMMRVKILCTQTTLLHHKIHQKKTRQTCYKKPSEKFKPKWLQWKNHTEEKLNKFKT